MDEMEVFIVMGIGFIVMLYYIFTKFKCPSNACDGKLRDTGQKTGRYLNSAPIYQCDSCGDRYEYYKGEFSKLDKY